MTVTVDTEELEAKVKDMYRDVAERPEGGFHFELGAPVALRAGYDADRLAAVPAGAVESFAGVGFFFDLADLRVHAIVCNADLWASCIGAPPSWSSTSRPSSLRASRSSSTA